MRQREERHSVLIRGRMRAGGPFVDVCIRNVSRNGMMLQALEAPCRGTFVEVRLPEDVVVGQVVWSSDRRFGIRTRERVPVWRLTGRPSLIERGPGQREMAAARCVAIRRRDLRSLGRSFEFAALALAVAAAAAMMAYAGYAALSGLTTQIMTHL